MKLCAIIPSRNHDRMVGGIVARIRAVGLPVFVVDDGSDPPAQGVIAGLADEANAIVVLRLEVSRGKGGAVLEGCRVAAAAGYTHALQVDADGQHDLDPLPQFIAAAQRYPQAVICGKPIYGAAIPFSRRVGHWIANFWVAVEVLSCRISGAMCGFRIYPLAAVRAVTENEHMGRGMDFDIEILVRLFWRRTPMHAIPVRVLYPPGNLSNFRLLADNWQITIMHTRLVLTMMRRLPSILWYRPPILEPKLSHWASLRERGTYCGLRICAGAYRVLGRRGCEILLIPVVAYFYLAHSGTAQRRASKAFLTRALGRPPRWSEGFRHYFSFAMRTLETFIAWVGDVPRQMVEASNFDVLHRAVVDKRGALIVVSHMGNLDLARVLLDDQIRDRMTLLVHTRHAPNFNRLLREYRPQAVMNTVQVAEIGPETAIELKERVERGEWIIIAGDRTPIGSRGRVSPVRFFGEDALFSDGPWILGALLECPVYLLFCLREGDRYRLTMEPFSDRITLPRGQRRETVHHHAERYAARLEHYARRQPYQWFNFFDFWAQ